MYASLELEFLVRLRISHPMFRYAEIFGFGLNVALKSTTPAAEVADVNSPTFNDKYSAHCLLNLPCPWSVDVQYI